MDLCLDLQVVRRVGSVYMFPIRGGLVLSCFPIYVWNLRRARRTVVEAHDGRPGSPLPNRPNPQGLDSVRSVYPQGTLTA